jgi:Predicted membrane protein (DUF2254)
MLLTTIDQRLGQAGSPLVFTGGPEAARTLLSTITSSMITSTGLVSSITMVVMQLTSSRSSPRVLQTFLRDRANQLAGIADRALFRGVNDPPPPCRRSTSSTTCCGGSPPGRSYRPAGRRRWCSTRRVPANCWRACGRCWPTCGRLRDPGTDRRRPAPDGDAGPGRCPGRPRGAAVTRSGSL